LVRVYEFILIKNLPITENCVQKMFRSRYSVMTTRFS